MNILHKLFKQKDISRKLGVKVTTLIISEIHQNGIIIVTDGRTSNNNYLEVRHDYQKYRYFPSKNKSISVWGFQHPFSDSHLDVLEVLSHLVDTQPNNITMDDLAGSIEQYMSQEYDWNHLSNRYMGIHLCGYKTHNGRLVPCLFHILNLRVRQQTQEHFRNAQGNPSFFAQNDIDIGHEPIPDGRANGTQQFFINFFPYISSLHNAARNIFGNLGRSRNPAERTSQTVVLRRRVFELIAHLFFSGSCCEDMGYEVIGGNIYYCIFNEHGHIEHGRYDQQITLTTT